MSTTGTRYSVHVDHGEDHLDFRVQDVDMDRRSREAVAWALRQIADRLEEATDADFEATYIN